MRLGPILVVTLSCAISWLVDAQTKAWAVHHDRAAILTVIPGLVHALVPPMMNLGGGSLIPGVTPVVGGTGIKHAAIVIPIVLSLASFAWMYRVERSTLKLTMSEQLGFGMLLGGTFSNLYDRLVRDAVIDFLHLSLCDFWLWNVADVTIALGLFLVGVDALRLHRLAPKVLKPTESGASTSTDI